PKVKATPPTSLPSWKAPASKVKSKDAPKFEPKGASDPKQLDQQINQKNQQAKQKQQSAAKGVASLAGAERVQGKDLEAVSSLAAQNAQIKPKVEKSPGMNAYLDMPMPDSFRAKVDLVAKPELLQSMSDVQTQVSDAIEKRDSEQAEHMAQAQTEANQLGAKAQAAQAETVKKSRQKIQTEKEKGIAESEAILTDYQQKAGDAKAAQFKKIENRIAQDDQRVQNKFEEADKKIKEEESKAEAQKEEAKQKTKKKKKKRSFWQKIGDAISSVVDAIADAVKKIGEALKKVVKGIISAAQKFATGIIDAARNFVVNAIQSFAKMAKGFLSVALAAFPGIRDKVLGLIDELVKATVEMIDMIANQLKEGIQYLVDKLNQAIDFVANFYESIIQGGLAMIKAVVTGNFDELPKIAFMTACNALGLPGEEFWMILMKAKDQALSIIKDPISFLKNLLKAGSKGFMQFMSNVAKHLEKGLFGWLFGKLTEAGIELPKKFDAAGIFFLVRQVLGATWGYVRERIVNLVGEENMERLEGVADYFQMLFTQGPMAVYNELKGQLQSLKPTIIKEIQSWVITTVIQKAVVKLMAMLIPGSGFVQAIWGMWQTLQFFIQNIRDIADLVNTVLDSLGLISKGMIGSAANYVEKVMVKTLPLVFRFMAKLIGLGGLSKKIAKIMAKLRKPVNKAIDSTIGKIARGGKALFNKAKKGAKKVWNKTKAGAKKLKAGATNLKDSVIKWWKKRKPIKTQSGTHTLYFKGNSEKSAVPMVASTPMTVKAKLSKWKARITPEAIPTVKAARSLITQAETILAQDPNSPKLVSLLKQLFDVFGQEAGGDVDSMSPDEKKAAARDKFVSIMKTKKEMGKAEIEQVLASLKEEFALSKASLEGDKQGPKIGLYASPALWLPLTTPGYFWGYYDNDLSGNPNILDGQKDGASSEAIDNGDFIRSVNHDGPYDTPGMEVINEFNRIFEDEPIKPSSGISSAKKSKSTVSPLTKDMLPSKLKTKDKIDQYYRAGKVEARSSVKRHSSKRSGEGETVFGYFGSDEKVILTGGDYISGEYNGGHLVGDQLMDGHKSFSMFEHWNLVPQIRTFNSPNYTSAIENPVAKAISSNKNAYVEYNVTVRYPDLSYVINDPRVLLSRLFRNTDHYYNQVMGAIADNNALANSPMRFTRRTPGFWQATAKVFNTVINTGNINHSDKRLYTNDPSSVGKDRTYVPSTATEKVKYSLEIDRGNGLEPVQNGPSPGNPLQVSGVSSIRETARQRTY
ncbi:MAG: DNA/RNA non-specific endonuclease, partial [Bacteroidota bacterium]